MSFRQRRLPIRQPCPKTSFPSFEKSSSGIEPVRVRRKLVALHRPALHRIAELSAEIAQRAPENSPSCANQAPDPQSTFARFSPNRGGCQRAWKHLRSLRYNSAKCFIPIRELPGSTVILVPLCYHRVPVKESEQVEDMSGPPSDSPGLRIDPNFVQRRSCHLNIPATSAFIARRAGI